MISYSQQVLRLIARCPTVVPQANVEGHGRFREDPQAGSDLELAALLNFGCFSAEL